jgi:hypothetical protein
MKIARQTKKPFGTANMVDITHVRYLSWEEAIDVEFEDGRSFLEPHATVRKANRISVRAVPVEIVLDAETRGGFEDGLQRESPVQQNRLEGDSR